MELGDVGPRHLGHAVVAKPRNDKALQHPFIALGGARLETEIDVLFLESLGELLDGDGTPIGITPGGWIVAVLGRGNDGDRPASSLLAGEHGAWPEADAAGPSPGAVLYNVCLRPLVRTRRPKPGRSSSQMKYSRARTSAASTMVGD